MSGFSAELIEADRDSPLAWELLRKPCSREELTQAIARVVGAPEDRACLLQGRRRQAALDERRQRVDVGDADVARPFSANSMTSSRASRDSARLTVSSVMPR
jgi:hypothetical protein